MVREVTSCIAISSLSYIDRSKALFFKQSRRSCCIWNLADLSIEEEKAKSKSLGSFCMLDSATVIDTRARRVYASLSPPWRHSFCNGSRPQFCTRSINHWISYRVASPKKSSERLADTCMISSVLASTTLHFNLSTPSSAPLLGVILPSPSVLLSLTSSPVTPVSCPPSSRSSPSPSCGTVEYPFALLLRSSIRL